ncbi:SDR family NAD(P)-dependent oxidoreductase [Shewanella sp. 202IG2-18]|uniref:type I polyketide synthase n=1 Tax=Parashewanella hymeniacidonis TaxID=2807618 RepID=UPI00195FAE2A|nr:type I polyketide synthase [Parashewanella hymeniacidonis]MBM7071253.1 SDR family NAD(P)-dependent oxidoreductase [Parashewanella hymeniacidonis]
MSQQDKRLNKRLKDTPIAIVGMASIFANSRYLNEFWDLISDEINAITDIPESHWRADDYYDSNKSTPDKIYCKRGGFLPDVDFNPMEFGLPPNILELTDTSQLLSLVVAKEVLADANLSEDYDRDRIGITLGIGGGQQISQSMNARLQYPVLRQVFKNSGISDEDSEMLIQKVQDQYVPWEENSFPGSLGNVTAGRVANRFNLGGMNCVVDAACAGSLAAIRMALTELTEHRSDMMITGGVDTDNSPYMYMSFSKTPAFTDKENITPFDDSSSGMMIGEGIGMIAIKRLEDAERDGDKIYAVIKGIGASSDGKFKSIYAPRPEGQAKALYRAYDDAGFAPDSVGLIEAHGTGTAAGDVAEFNGLNSVFSENNNQKQHIALGSIKSQIGHTKATAGTAGLIKAALSLHHKVLPPTINVNNPNPKLGVEDSPFYINSETRPWIAKADDTPRRAGISSFGFGGTNFHVVLEEYTQEHEEYPYRQRNVATSLLIDAPTKSQLISQLEQIKQTGVDINALAKSYSHRKLADNNHRIGFVVSSVTELEKELVNAMIRLASDESEWQLPSGTSYQAQATKGKVAALFAGQGSQFVNMGKTLACNFPELRQQVALSDKVFIENNQPSLSSKLFPIPVFSEQERKSQLADLTNTAFAQSAIGALSVAQFDLLTKAGFKAELFGGHSFGELSALYASGVLNKQDYTTLAFARGQAMASAPEGVDTGNMAAVILPAESDALEKLHTIIEQFDGVKIANDNSDIQQVIAGGSNALAQCSKVIKEQLGYKVIALPVSGAFHTPLVAHAQQPFANAINDVEFNSPLGTVFSNATANAYPADNKQIQKQFTEHMLQSVHFRQQVREMYAAGARIFVEFGPKDILQKLVKANLTKHSEDIKVISLNPNAKGDSDKQYRQAAMQLAVAGIELSNIDPYKAEISHPETAAGMSFKLNGNNYISPATQQKMQTSLKTGEVSTQIEYVDREVEKVVEKIIEKTVESPMTSSKTPQIEQTSPQAGNQTVASGDTLGAFFSAQDQVAQLHQQFLSIPKQYGDTFSELMAEQAEMASKGLAIPEALTRSMEMFHQHQSQTLKSHEQFMQLQAEQNQAALSLLNGVASQAQRIAMNVAKPSVQANTPLHSAQPQVTATKPAIATPVAKAQPLPVIETPKISESSLNADQVQQTMLNVVADKTGYPTEMLDLTMDMEADLGIDSIKRVEILGTVQDQLPELPELSAEDLAECRTLGEIVSYMNSQLGSSSTANTNHVETTATVSSSVTGDQVQQTMLDVVADKTGYPTEMLDLAMDMEADLGIDSIKRVEILGTVQDQLPELPELSAEDLAECRTLGEIVAYMNSQLDHSPAIALQVEPIIAATKSLTSNQVQQTMLDVVADKTGYPAEMLDLAMDMEADLGIDSIKRVEILGTVQDQLPELPELSAEDLAECRTLGEIVTYMNSQLGDSSPVEPTVEPAFSSTSNLTSDQVQQTMLNVVADKTGYPAEMLDFAMDMEADLGIDSIKRVEILGTVQEQLPELPELNAEDLAECRTLGEIVAYMNSQLSASPLSPTQVIVEPAANAELVITDVELPPHSEVALKKLPAAINAELNFPKGSVVIINDDGQNAGLLAEKLTAQGLIVAVIHAPVDILEQQSPVNSDITQITLENISDKSIEDALTQIQSLGHIAGFIHLQPKGLNSQATAVKLSESAMTHVESAFLWAKHLQPVLASNSVTRFVTTSRIDGGFGYFNAELTSQSELNQAALAGLTKTLSHEWQKVSCKALDIEPELESNFFADAIIAEFATQHDVIEVGITKEQRFTLVATETAEQQSTAADISATDKVLVTGGAKGVTLKCALALAVKSKAHFILAGRSDYLENNQLPDWAKSKVGSELKAAAIAELQAQNKKPTPKLVNELIKPVNSSLEIANALQQFEQVGASAEYISLDVSRAKHVQTTLSTLSAIAPITGLIHGAGVLADKHIQDKTLDELSRVYGTKVSGLKHVLSALQLDSLKLIALFSSAAGFYGNEGQSDYAMSNEILNKAALQLSQKLPKTKVISFDWGPWDGGMVNDALKKMFIDRGVYVIPLDAGAALFAEKILSESASQLLIGSDMQGNSSADTGTEVKKLNADLAQFDLALDPQQLGLIEHHKINGNLVLPTVCALQWLQQQAEAQTNRSLKILDYQLLKGVAFDSQSVKLMSLKLEQHDQAYLATIWCDNKPQYKARLISVMASETFSLLDKAIAEHQVSGTKLYQNGSLFHGPKLQAIKQVTHFDGSGLIADIQLPQLSVSDWGAFSANDKYNAVASDALLQAMLVWAKLQHNQASLPVSIGEFVCVSALKNDQVGRLVLNIVQNSKTGIIADVALYHQNGDLSCYMKQTKVSLSPTLVFEPFADVETSGAVS